MEPELNIVATPPMMVDNSERGHLTEVVKESEVKNALSLLKAGNVDTRYLDRKKRVRKRSRSEMVSHKEMLVSEFFKPIVTNQPKTNWGQNTECGVINCFPCFRGTIGTGVLRLKRHVEGEYLGPEELIKLMEQFWINQSDQVGNHMEKCSGKLDPYVGEQEPDRVELVLEGPNYHPL